jgi:hypothetical protein
MNLVNGSQRPVQRYTVIGWDANSDGSFSVEFAVTSPNQEEYEAYRINIPFQGEDPALFFAKLRNYMVSHVAYLDSLSAIKQQLGGFTFTDCIIQGVSNVSQ